MLPCGRKRPRLLCAESDIRLSNDPFKLVGCLSTTASGWLRRSLWIVRRDRRQRTALSNPIRILAKILRNACARLCDNRGNVPDGLLDVYVDSSRSFRSIVASMSDTSFIRRCHLCARLRIAGYDVRLCSNARVCMRRGARAIVV